MSDPGIVFLMATGVAGVAYVIRTIANAVFRLQDRKIAASTTPSVSDDRMARLENAVDAIAIEVERISEGQRFVSRLLGEQSHQVTPKLEPGKVDTPH